MTKTGKRTLALVIWIVVIFMVGCLFYTGNRLKGYPNLSEYEKGVYSAKDGTMVVFTGEQIWYGNADGEIILLEIVGYKDGMITMAKNNTAYRFLAVDASAIYDVERDIFLIRRTSRG